MAGEDAHHRRHRTHDDHAEEPPRTPPRHRIGGYEEEATEDHHVAIRLTIHVAITWMLALAVTRLPRAWLAHPSSSAVSRLVKASRECA